MKGLKRKIVTGCGNTHLTAFFNKEGKLQECFYSRGSAGGCESSYTAISRLVSLALRMGIPAEDVIDQLKSVQPCPAYKVRSATKHDTSKGTACASAMGFALEDMIEEMAIINDEITDKFMGKIQDIKKSTAIKNDNVVNTSSELNAIVERARLFDCVSGSIKSDAPVAVHKNVKTADDPDAGENGVCPDCGSHVIREGGCNVCKICGWSRCG